MVDYNGLENRRTERYRGFESLSLRERRTVFAFFHGIKTLTYNTFDRV